MSTESNAPEPVGEEAMQILDEALIRYQQALDRDATAIGYLRSRGFDREDVVNFRLGVVSDPLPGHHRFEGMLVIPYLWRDGRPLTMRFRCIQDHQHVGHGKYNSITGDPGRMFNVRALHEADDEMHVTEGECFPDGAEVLTPRGWVDFADLVDDDRVAQWNDDGSIEFVKPLAYIEKEFDGELINFKHKGIEMTMTPGHRVPFFTKHTRKFRRADEVKQGGWFPRVGVLDGEGTGYSKDELALMLAISADMTVVHRRNSGYNGRVDCLPYVHGAFVKVRKMHRLSGLLERLGIDYNATRMDGYMQYTFRLPEKYAFDRMLDHSLLAKMSGDEAEFILSELIEWDGNLVPNRNQAEYSTKYEANAIWVQTVAHLAGRVSTLIHRRNEHGEWIKVSILHSKSMSSWQSMKRTDVPYKGKVRCVMVPSGAILVRQHGYITVSGNCDAIVLNKVGLPAVAMPGATTWRSRHRRMLAGFSRIHVWGDPDDAGSAFVMKVTNALKQAHAVPIKGGDVNEVFMKEGAAGLLRLVR